MLPCPRPVLLAVFAAGVVSLTVLHIVNPQEASWIPPCPFFAVTGLKCPGCGTLRGIHNLLHLRFRAAWELNPLMVVSIPLILALLAFPRLRRNVVLGWSLLAVTLFYWVLRNLL